MCDDDTTAGIIGTELYFCLFVGVRHNNITGDGAAQLTAAVP
jgi:hypothetical protein